MKTLLSLLILGTPVALIFMLFGVGFIKALVGGVIMVIWIIIISELVRRIG